MTIYFSDGVPEGEGMSEGWMSVEAAADRLGRSPSQIRKLAQAGALAGRRLAGVWVLDEDAVSARAAQYHGPGRPLSTAHAWLVLAVLAHELDPQVSVPVIDDRRARYQLRHLIENAPPVESWNRWLRNRARPRRVWVHDGVLDALAEDERLHPSGAYAAQQAGTDLAAGPARAFYVYEADVAALLADFRAQDAADGQILLHVLVGERAPSDAVIAAAGPVPLAVAAVDLLESPASRDRHLAEVVLTRALEDARHSLAIARRNG